MSRRTQETAATSIHVSEKGTRSDSDQRWCRIAKAFLERLNDIARKMRTMLQDVRSEARAMLKEHQKQGGLFTIQPSSGADHTVGDAYNAVNAQMAEPMTAPMMALSLLSNTSFLIDHGVMNLTLPRLPLMYPGDPGAQDKCLEAVDKVLLLVLSLLLSLLLAPCTMCFKYFYD